MQGLPLSEIIGELRRFATISAPSAVDTPSFEPSILAAALQVHGGQRSMRLLRTEFVAAVEGIDTELASLRDAAGPTSVVVLAMAPDAPETLLPDASVRLLSALAARRYEAQVALCQGNAEALKTFSRDRIEKNLLRFSASWVGGLTMGRLRAWEPVRVAADPLIVALPGVFALEPIYFRLARAAGDAGRDPLALHIFELGLGAGYAPWLGG